MKITLQLNTRLKYTSVVVAAALSISAIPTVNATPIHTNNIAFNSGFTDWANRKSSSSFDYFFARKKFSKFSGHSKRFEKDLEITKGTNYVLTAYIKGEGEIGAIVDGVYYKASSSGNGKYKKATVSFNSKNATAVTIYSIYDGAKRDFDDFTLTTANYESSVPYDYTQYQNILEIANLQQTDIEDCIDANINDSCSKSDVIDAGGYDDYSSEYFYIDKDSGWLTFEMKGNANRTELRFVENFKTNTSVTHSLVAEVLPISPFSSVSSSGIGKEITLLQVHNKGENAATDDTVLSHPLLRVIWDGESRLDSTTGNSHSEGYWAIIKSNAFECSNSSKAAYVENCPDSYEYYYLADYDPDNATKFEIVTGNEQLIVNVDGKEVVNHDISYWSHLYSYFKAGVYNQYEGGNSVVQFKTITYTKDGELASTNQVAQLSDTTDTDTGELRYKIPEAQTTGTLKASILYEKSGTKTAYVTLFDSANSVSSDIADVRLKSGKVYLRTEDNASFDTGLTFPEGEWFDIEISWDTEDKNTYSLTINGVYAGSFTSENKSTAVQTIAVRYNSNSDTTTETLHVDNLQLYSDEAATTLVYEDDFDTNWVVDSSLDTPPYNSATQEAIVVLDPTKAPDDGGSEPGDGGTEPGDGGTEPGDGGTEPGDGGTEPGDGGTEPGDGGTEPGDGGTEPGEGEINQVAKITDTIDTDTGELRYKLSDAQTEGTVKASVFYEEGGVTTTYLSLFDSAHSVSSDIADIRLKSGKVYLRTEVDSSFDTGLTFPEGEWFDITVSWDTVNTNSYSLVVNGVDGGTYTSENEFAAVQTLALRYNSNSGVTTEVLYIDDFEIYADQAAETLVYGDDFDTNWVVKDSLDTSPYNSSTQEAIVSYDPIVDIDPIDTEVEPSKAVPYDHVQYQNALDNSNLQQTNVADCTSDDINASCSKSDVVRAGGYANYDSEYFYIDKESGWLTFEMEGDSNRTELRFVEDFKTNSTDLTYTLSAEILPILPQDSVAQSGDGQEITLLQVHNKGENAETDETVLSHPLLRLVWDGENRKDDVTGLSYSNAYWAIIKTNAYECSKSTNPAYVENCPDSYDSHYLGDYDAENATKFDIIAGNEKLIVNVDEKETVNHDISYWSHLYSYFKAGVYNQYEDGNSIVRFKSVDYSVNDASEELAELPSLNLNANVAPATNFDLSTWNLSVPVDSGEEDSYAKATTIKVKELNDGNYELTDYFWTDTVDGGMVFKDYIGGARTSEGTSFTRTELREMLRGENTSISTKGINGNNWVFSSVPLEMQEKAGGVDGKMVATIAVNHVTTTGHSSYVGRVIIGQIHAGSDEPIRLYYRLLPGHTQGSIYFAHEPSNGNEQQYYEMIGSKSSSASEPENGIALDEKFSYEIDIVGNMMTVNIMRDGKETVTQVVDMTASGYADGYYDKDGDGVDDTEDYMYFKAGVYNQNKLVDEKDVDGNEIEGGDGIDDYGTDADDYVQATFYYLKNTH